MNVIQERLQRINLELEDAKRNGWNYVNDTEDVRWLLAREKKLTEALEIYASGWDAELAREALTFNPDKPAPSEIA